MLEPSILQNEPNLCRKIKEPEDRSLGNSAIDGTLPANPRNGDIQSCDEGPSCRKQELLLVQRATS